MKEMKVLKNEILDLVDKNVCERHYDRYFFPLLTTAVPRCGVHVLYPSYYIPICLTQYTTAD